MALFVVGLGVLPRSTRADVVVNGDFSTGDLSGWTTFVTTNGDLGDHGVSSFNVTGLGLSLAARFEVGQVTFAAGENAGGGIFQTVNTPGGTAFLHADVASVDVHGSTVADLGDYSLLLDGVTVASLAFDGSYPGGTSLRGALDYTGEISAGDHILELLITRPFQTQNGVTPYMFADNISLSVSSVPEPTPAHLLSVALACAAYKKLRVNRKKTC